MAYMSREQWWILSLGVIVAGVTFLYQAAYGPKRSAYALSEVRATDLATKRSEWMCAAMGGAHRIISVGPVKDDQGYTVTRIIVACQQYNGRVVGDFDDSVTHR